MEDKQLDWELGIQQSIERLAAGDQAAFEVVYAHTIDDVYRTVSFLVFDKQDVQDLVNEVYMQMWKSLHTYDHSRSFRFWLHGLIVWQVQDWKRKVWRRLRLLDRKKSLEVEGYAETGQDDSHPVKAKDLPPQYQERFANAQQVLQQVNQKLSAGSSIR